MPNIGKQMCLVVGTPRGFTRSVLQALLKRGSKVMFACSDQHVGIPEHTRLSSLYGPHQVLYHPLKDKSFHALESLFLKALATFGEINCVVNSTANDKLQLRPEILQGDLNMVERKLDSLLVEQDVNSITRVGHLATKYMGKQNGFLGGTLLNLTSSVELTGGSECGGCTVLGMTRSLGLDARVGVHGVKTCTVYQPTIDYPDFPQAAQITDDQHSPYYEWNKYSSYIREYTGYMALHTGETQQPGTAWTFNQRLRLEEVTPENIGRTCSITNKMCFWLGCPLVSEEEHINQMMIRKSELGEHLLEQETVQTEEVGDS